MDPAELAAAKARISLVALVGAEVKLKRAGKEFQGLCPFHKEKSGSFYIYPDNHYHCFGCGAHGDPVSWLMERRRMSFREAADFLMGRGSAPASFEQRFRRAAEHYAEAGFRDEEKRDREKRHQALEIWNEAQPIAGSLAERYLRKRAISLPLRFEALRYHDKLFHKESASPWPALVAGVTDSRGLVVAVQRIWLGRASAGKAPISPVKKTMGILKDGAVRLGKAGRVLGLAEGIETALSAQQLYTLPVWASLGTEQMAKVWLPPVVEEVVIFRDDGQAGFAAAVKAAEAFEDRGRRVMIEPPPKPHGDFNDVLQARARHV